MPASRHRESARKTAVDGVDLLYFKSARLRDQRRQLLRPEHPNSAGGERSADQRPVGVHETEEAARGQLIVVSNGRLDSPDLLQNAIDQLGAITRSDKEPLCPLAEDAAVDP